MEIGVEVERVRLSRDATGFERRACPICARHFKVSARSGEERVIQAVFVQNLQHANAEELRGPPRRFCPYCGHQASADAFLTAAQRQYIEACAKATAGQMRYEQLKQVERRLGENPYLTFVVMPPGDPTPAPPAEPDDMHTARLICCGDELKLKTSWKTAFFCHHCRARHGAGA